MNLIAKLDEPEEIKTPDELRQRLSALRENVDPAFPLIVTLDGVHEHQMVIGLTPDRGFVQVSPADGSPPYMVTIGGQDDKSLRPYYLHAWHHTEIRRRHELTSEDAIEVAIELLRTGKLSQRVDWEEV